MLRSRSPAQREDGRPRCNILGPTALGFRHRDDLTEVRKLLELIGIDINVVAPAGATPSDLSRLADADFNVVLYPEIAGVTAQWLRRNFAMPFTRTVPIGIKATREFITEVGALAHVNVETLLAEQSSRASWYSKSVDSNYLTGKRVFVFGDGTHAVAAARVARDELGFEVVGLGTYSREFGREVREAAQAYGLEALISDDYLEVEARIAELQPELVLGTQMERHIAKRLGIACAVISAPAHVQDFPARYSPQMGFEGANVLFDTWVQPLMMGLEEHLLTMFSNDFEFNGAAGASHLQAVRRTAAPEAPGAPAARAIAAPQSAATAPPAALAVAAVAPTWAADAEAELIKIPFFVRGKARRNTERFARERGVPTITVETLYDAKSHFSR
jgi:light-independent protochlorophyllide reductase subunit B